MAEISDALGDGPAKRFCGREWNIRFLDLNGLVELERRVGTLGDLDVAQLEHLRLFLWLVLRNSDPSLTEAQRDAGEYLLTENEVGRMINLKILKTSETNDFIRDLMIGSGILDGPEDAPKNAPTEKGKKSPSPA